ncbi:radical SAM family heme chaperone HemW [Varunaivibrio sulfuroxidans]|uniref:Heme chaperone HemW n=1 Tax=Varunaivibrio sulfuroxidans TaxID=1773489 RepID=A0A4R3JI21_9PROT|nr:radical SAM family heme chaperone HemW [Varunaivibrio sulfuroxidans]TCS64906.1 oxygen-independent coproporphyrinogen-3 oxidase [Varunaivibrio sulfuroxidans]WES29800.1 radical SAM family heme chaperone HemW [Varunaivibrio sulfuroxidans]
MTDEAIALYIHWPFCLSKCPYCDFNSHASDRAAIDQARWRDALLREVDHYAVLCPGRPLGSLFFGGGTPSLMDPETVRALIARARRHWPWNGDIEITLEANPTSVETARLEAFRDAGVNRVSLGVQSLDDDALRFLGRGHSAAEALRAVRTAADHFDRFSFDLIYARPEQTPKDWRDELGRALDVAGGHLSLYQLTIEPGTAYFRDGVTTADEDAAATLFEITQQLCADAGLPAYEISNHARPDQQSRHNLTYWRGGEYIGVGPGAHGRILQDGRTHATHQIATPARWLERVDQRGHGTAKSTPLDASQRRDELVMTGLRLSAGIDRERFERQTGAPILDVFSRSAVNTLIEGGFITLDNRALRATPAGLLRLNGVIATLLA